MTERGPCVLLSRTKGGACNEMTVHSMQRVFDELTAGILTNADAAPSHGVAQQAHEQHQQPARQEPELELPSVPF